MDMVNFVHPRGEKGAVPAYLVRRIEERSDSIVKIYCDLNQDGKLTIVNSKTPFVEILKQLKEAAHTAT